MIEEILPATVVSVETRGDIEDAALFPAERLTVDRAVPKRRREFATGRACARDALAQLQVERYPIPRGARGEPLWPAGIVGSITHCEGYRAAAVARASAVLSVGIDAEPHEPLPDGVLEAIAAEDERAWIARLCHSTPAVHWDRLLFCAKEAVYKTWFPLTHSWLGFEDAHVEVDVAASTFVATLLVSAPAVEAPLDVLRGRWLVRDGLVLAAIALAAPPVPATARKVESARTPT
ncbi:MAG TPA: 4'-phosphopantetheinyl transferase superfamily protein [Solirubrobacteraceae bacterium]|nr:4'-phosphopantetheinyl transferase superfamily protein [Solirubrobacteraceae bacterium]